MTLATVLKGIGQEDLPVEKTWRLNERHYGGLTGLNKAETAAKHFAGESGLMLLALDADQLGDTLKWEPSRGGALFPHLYRDLQLDEVLWAKALSLVDGVHVLPEGV